MKSVKILPDRKQKFTYLAVKIDKLLL